jgi:predicted branched-subunit amino acid permease
LSALSIAAILVALLRPAAVRPSTLVISAVTLVVALATGPALVIATYVLVGYYIPLPARYGMVLLPAFLACIALFLGSWGRRGSGAIAVVGAAAALVALAT